MQERITRSERENAEKFAKKFDKVIANFFAMGYNKKASVKLDIID